MEKEINLAYDDAPQQVVDFVNTLTTNPSQRAITLIEALAVVSAEAGKTQEEVAEWARLSLQSYPFYGTPLGHFSPEFHQRRAATA